MDWINPAYLAIHKLIYPLFFIVANPKIALGQHMIKLLVGVYL